MTKRHLAPPTKFGATTIRTPQSAIQIRPGQRLPSAVQPKPQNGFISNRVVHQPPPTRFGAVANVQSKPSAGASPLVDRHVTTQPKWSEKLPCGAIVQRSSLARHAFSSETQNAVLLVKGQHRRHIIPNHLMKQALQAWLNAHSGVISPSKMQELLDKMNDYVPNLHPGDGVQNSAQGMIGTWGEKKLLNIGGGFSSSDVGGLFDKPSGFFQQHQKDILVVAT